MGNVKEGFLLLADITGYTGYLAITELDHAQEILTEILELLVGKLKEKLHIVKLEGDAVFSHVSLNEIADVDEIIAIIEETYTDFRNKTNHIIRNTTCECDACILVPKLDLKFFLHKGKYFIQDVLGIKELVGSDVNVVHRITKNHMSKYTEWTAYTMITEQAISGYKSDTESLFKHSEEYEHIGIITTYNFNLRDWFEVNDKAEKVYVSKEDADLTLNVIFNHSPEIVWYWLTDFEKRNLLHDGFIWVYDYKPRGNLGIGQKNHCEHGGQISYETIVDWRPFDYYTTDYREDLEKETLFDGYFTFQFFPSEEGTDLSMYLKFTMEADPKERAEFIEMFRGRGAEMYQHFSKKMDEFLLKSSQ